VPNASGEAWRRRLVRCAIYTRQSVSSSDSLSSCDVQYDACRLYLESQRELGWTLLPERFDDEGYSGASLDRPALSRLLANIRHGAVDQVLIHRFDRLSRNVRDCVTLLDEIRRLEVGLVVVTAPELGHSAQDNFLLNIMASFAEFEREMIAGRIADSTARLKARRLRFAGGVPFGYDADARTKQFIPNETEAAIVRWMFAEAAAGKRPSDIAATANARGYRTKAPSGVRLWTARQVLSTLRNPVHVGMLKDGRDIRLGTHPGIVSHELFDAAAQKLEERRTRKVAHYGPMWPLKGRLECGNCGRPLSPHSSRRGNKVYRYYRCRATAGGRPPCGYQVSAGGIENEVADRLPNGSRDDPIRRRIGELVEHVVYDPETRRIQIRWRSHEGVTVGYVW
jgi:site-specific DNA recombinase